MNNANNIQRVVTWNTQKVSNGFAWTCYSFDYQVANVVHYSGVETSRAIAMNRAKTATRYVKSLQK